MFVTCLCLAGTANATLMSADWKVAGDGLLTRDDVNGLEWLDLTESTNRSYNSVIGEFGAGGDFAGFRYADVTELTLLFSQAGFAASALNTGNLSGNKTIAQALVNLLGVTGTSNAGTRFTSKGLVVNPAFTNPALSGAFVDYSTQFNTGAISTGNGGTENDSSTTFGSWLVRSSATVPEPTTFVLLGLGLFGLGFNKRKRL